MYLLFWLQQIFQNTQIIVASVNYKTRLESDKEIELVEKYCKKHKIIFESAVYDARNSTKNFENWARVKRYEFFNKIYKKYQCFALYLGHHKDDFLETCIMQKKSKRLPVFWGIKEVNFLNEMNIVRPFLHLFFKTQILKKIHDFNIPYMNDSSNDFDVYTRNSIRLEIKDWSFEQKNTLINSYKKLNEENKVLESKINYDFKLWEQSNFDNRVFKKMKNQEKLMFKYIHQNYSNIKLSSSKLDSILHWYLMQKGTGKYLIKSNVFIFKVKGCLFN